MKKIILILLNLIFLIASACDVHDCEKYTKQIQRQINNLPKINEASMGNNSLNVRYKIKMEDEKWHLDYYPFYWKKIATLDFEDNYFELSANKTGFAQNKYSLNGIEYQKNGAIDGFLKTKILKNSKTKKKIIAFKYGIKNPIDKTDKSWHEVILKNVLFFDFDIKNDKYTRLVYNSGGDLLCSGENCNDLSLDIEDIKLEADDSFIKSIANSVKKSLGNAFAFAAWFVVGD